MGSFVSANVILASLAPAVTLFVVLELLYLFWWRKRGHDQAPAELKEVCENGLKEEGKKVRIESNLWEPGRVLSVIKEESLAEIMESSSWTHSPESSWSLEESHDSAETDSFPGFCPPLSEVVIVKESPLSYGDGNATYFLVG